MSVLSALATPSEAEVAISLVRFAETVRAHFGERLVDLILFGSRARGDHRSESDVDVAVILREGDGPARADRDWLSDLTYDRIVDDGVDIQAWPITEAAWSAPDGCANPALLRSIRREGCPLRAGP